MKNKRNKNIYKAFLIFSLLFVFILISSTCSICSMVADAVTVTGYSGVLSDLMIDDNFNKDDFPANEDDKNLQVIQIAESTGGELFLYTYQPNVKTVQYKLTQVAISQHYGEKFNFELYDLKLIDSDGVFAKYRVNNIEVKSSIVRYYIITEIFREFDEKAGDTQPTNGNTITEVAIAVSQSWQADTINGEVYYYCDEEKTIDITDFRVGFVEYENGFSLKNKLISETSCHSHYVAFSTDYQIDDLYEADVVYDSQSRVYTTIPEKIDPLFGSVNKDEKAYLKYTDESQSFDASGWFHHQTYTWDTIQTASEFIESTADVTVYQKSIVNVEKNVVLTEEAKNDIKNMQHVLRFLTTDYTVEHKKYNTSPGGLTVGVDLYYDRISDTSITNVSILRLKFLSKSHVYNLGAVMNKANGTGISDGYTVTTGVNFNGSDWFEQLLEAIKNFFKEHPYILLIIIIVLAVILLGIFTPVLKYIFKGILIVLKVLWYIISAPFTFIKFLFDKGGG